MEEVALYYGTISSLEDFYYLDHMPYAYDFKNGNELGYMGMFGYNASCFNVGQDGQYGIETAARGVVYNNADLQSAGKTLQICAVQCNNCTFVFAGTSDGILYSIGGIHGRYDDE